jgi:hypothetical protein
LLAALAIAASSGGAETPDGPAPASAAAKEYQVKAAFLYNFTKFIEWPPRSFSGPEDPIVIGVLGDGPFAAELEQVVMNRNVNGRGLVVKPVVSVAEAQSVDVLFVSEAQEYMFGEIAPVIAHNPILTIGESRAYAHSGGIINFVLDNDKVRFEINMEAAERAGLKVSAQLQKLARAITKE